MNACRTSKGDEIDLALSFALLCRALGIRAKVVRCFRLESPTMSSCPRYAAEELGGEMYSMFQFLVRGGFDEETALCLVVEAEAEGRLSKVHELMAFVGLAKMGPKPSLKGQLQAWVECFDETSGQWFIVDTVNCFLCLTPRGNWIRGAYDCWVVSSDDCLKGEDHCIFEDVTEKYSRDGRDKSILSHSTRFVRRKLKKWWDATLEAFCFRENVALPPQPKVDPGQTCELILDLSCDHMDTEVVDCCDDDSDESWEVKSYHGPLEAMEVMEAMECQADAECGDDIADNAASNADEAAENAEEFPSEKSTDGMQGMREMRDGEDVEKHEKHDVTDVVDVVTDVVCLSEECEASADSDVIIGDVTMGSMKVHRSKRTSTPLKGHRVRKVKSKKAGQTKRDKGESGFTSVEPFEENAKMLQIYLDKKGIRPWCRSRDPEERDLGSFCMNVKQLKQQGRLKPELCTKLAELCPLWTELVEEIPVKREKVSESILETAVEEPEPPRVGDAQWLRATLQLTKCKSVAARRNTLRKLQLCFHPDKNRNGGEEARRMFEFVQSMWEKEFRS
eukprot:symbB.v1.2.022616.t1/scaffold1976.1/size93997/3